MADSSPVDLISRVRARAAAARRRIVFPESGDPRVLEAIAALHRERIVEPLLVVDAADRAAGSAAYPAGVAVLEMTEDLRLQTAARLLDRRAAKGVTPEVAGRLAAMPLYAADALVAAGLADGCVAGAVHTTADVLRAGLWIIGTAPGVRTVSSAFYMVTAPFRGERGEVLTFTDCAVVPYPTAAQLADIAVAAAEDRRRIVGDEPRVALLSFSTKGSGSGESVDRMTGAMALLKERGCDFPVDGELQSDAALIPSVAARKAPGSDVAGRANVLVFPSLDAGNLAYKLVERLAGARAIGPIVQGMARPCSDLSRGAASDDIINVAAITALQADPATITGADNSRWETES